MLKLDSPDTEEKPTSSGGKGMSQRLLFLALLMVVALFGYLYFFTGVIKPREEAAKAPAEQTVMVKKPIPPRPETPGEKEAKPEEKNPVQAKPAVGNNTEQAKPQVKTETKPAASAKPALKKEAEPEGSAQKEAMPDEKKVRDGYTLLIGYYAENEVKNIQAKLEKAAVAPVHKKSVKRVELMHRLFLAEFADHDAAKAELEKLKKLTSDAFTLEENGKYVVYAGSYLREGRAARIQDRLYDQGVKLILKKAEVKVPVVRFTAGAFSGKEEARKEVQRLKKLGLEAMVIRDKTGSHSK